MKEWPVLLSNPITDPSKGAEGGVDEQAKNAADAEVRRVETQLREARSALASAQQRAQEGASKAKEDAAREEAARARQAQEAQAQRAEAAATATAAASASGQSQTQPSQSPSGASSFQTATTPAAQPQATQSPANAADQPLMTRPQPARMQQQPATVAAGNNLVDPTRPTAGAVLPGGKLQTYDVLGRRGFADFINGQYAEQDGLYFDGHAVFKRTYTTEAGYSQPTSKDLFMFFHAENGAWAISHHMGSRGIVAYTNSRADRPSDIRGVWKVTTRDGHFTADEHVRVELSTPGMSAFRRSLQSGHEMNFFQYRLNGSQVADLVDELRSPNCRIARLKLYLNHLQTSQMKQIVGALNNNSSVTHLQLRENNVNDEIAEQLGQVLSTNGTLRMISLRNNKIGDEGAKWLSEAIRRNKTLEGLS
jgi:hypothetical protein